MKLEKIEALFEAHRNPNEAYNMKKYMRDQFEYLGIKSPLRAGLKAELLKDQELKSLDAESLIPLIYELWNLEFREYQYLAMEVLDRKIKKAPAQMVEHLEFLIVTKPWWDTVDFIASHLVGALFSNHRELIMPTVLKWMKSNNMWLQRTVLLYQLKYKKNTNEKMLFDAIIKLYESKEFFIQKAIGWALREYGKSNPRAVAEFVSHTQLAPLSKREALRIIIKSEK
jgi:3-methyladenine DNA glycosylase AlkD